ncbi:hypothetical protein K3495_g10830 [Podosphaera aphanis]|nr:hypothetical protein K3495_g10830 [Podosphaera aphanis]
MRYYRSPKRSVGVTKQASSPASVESHQANGVQNSDQEQTSTENRVCVTPFNYRGMFQGKNINRGVNLSKFLERNLISEESIEYDIESFPQYCMTCEKQLELAKNSSLYCSESCRTHDQSFDPLKDFEPTRSRNSSCLTLTTLCAENLLSTPYPAEGPDIIPPLSPTPPTHSCISLTAGPSNSALESLRSLSIHIPYIQKDSHSNISQIRSGTCHATLLNFRALAARPHYLVPLTQAKSSGMLG